MHRTPRVSLDVIDVARPCPADWDRMIGDDRVRFCKDCSLHVYNLSAMTRAAAEQFVAQREGRLCVQFFRRLDGTVITADCEGGWRLAARKATQRAGRWATATAAVLLSAALAPFGGLTRWSSASMSTSKDGDMASVLPGEAAKGDPELQAGDGAQHAPRAFLGRMVAPPQPRMVRGELAVPLMGDIVLPAPPSPPKQPPPQVAPQSGPVQSPTTQPAVPGPAPRSPATTRPAANPR